ncbi:hypothetical protein RFI_00780 [Reticulomyxa filosa]|uniref:Uncharacterized protein n=1 Tax=Reticulomyxa filosa TaxID=46433 RepID=X6PF28_RETFI|nr:hypothetical protein RFI_00780 [Reticulomyxa filosa]|eukprot:ETO36282.1 hypothetical protein RFI_00780 [Reticulomyxa filosa]
MQDNTDEKALYQFLNENRLKVIQDTSIKLSSVGVTLKDLMDYREDEIKKLCEKLEVNLLSAIDLCKILRHTPNSRCYVDTINKIVVVPAVILNNEDQERLEKIFEENKGLSKKKERLEKEMELIKKKVEQEKIKLEKSFDEMVSKMLQHKKKF